MTKRSAHSPQRGFGLLSLTLAMAIATVLTIALIKTQEFERKISVGRVAAGHMNELGRALSAYLTDQGTAIAAQFDSWGSSSSPSRSLCYHTSLWYAETFNWNAASPGTTCNLVVQRQNGTQYTVQNAMLPSMQELRDLGYLSPATSTRLMMSHGNSVRERRWTASPNGTAEATLAVLVHPVCVPNLLPRQPNSSPVCPDQGVRMEGLVFNTQPYRDPSNDPHDLQPVLNAMLLALEGDGAHSSGGGGGELTGYRGQFQIINPVRVVDITASGGVPGIVALRVQPYRAAGGGANNADFTRRDGSAPPTSPWDFANQPLRNVGEFTAASAAVAGDVRANGNLIADGNISTSAGNISGFGHISTSVGNITTTSGSVEALAGRVAASAVDARSVLKLPASKIKGNSCDPSTETLSISSRNGWGTLLICKPSRSSSSGSSVWHLLPGLIDFNEYQTVFVSRDEATITPPNSSTKTYWCSISAGVSPAFVGNCYVRLYDTGLAYSKWFPQVVQTTADNAHTQSSPTFKHDKCGSSHTNPDNWCVIVGGANDNHSSGEYRSITIRFHRIQD